HLVIALIVLVVNLVSRRRTSYEAARPSGGLVDTGAREGLKPENSIFPREVIPFAQFSAGSAEESVLEGVRRLERSRIGTQCTGRSHRVKLGRACRPLSFPEKRPMNALLIYPEFPETFWSFKHALKFLGKRAAQPPLGLMTVAALLPRAWNKRLVDTNVEPLRDRDLAWADVVMLSGMHIQSESLLAIVERCRARGLRTVVGGPIASSVPVAELKADHVVIGEAESLIADLARELEAGTARPVYQAAERPEMTASPLPDLSLIKMHRYSTMTVQYSRGCPFNCEFCDIIEIYGRRPRTKAVAQVLAELDQLRAAGWRESVFVVDDNFIGNKARAKELLRALVEWRTQVAAGFDFITEASLNLADDPELMQLMKDAGFKSVFLGIETPDESGLIASNKLQNTRRSLLESVAKIQSYGMQVMGGFILGFDTDKEDIFDRMVEFIQKSGIPIAMVGLLQAMPGTQLFRRLQREGRIVDAGDGDNTFCDRPNFLPRMDAAKLVEGYREVMKRIYNCEAYYERVKLYLSRTHPKPEKLPRGQHVKRQPRPQSEPWMTRANLRALVHSIVRQGVFGRHQWSYWKFVAEVAARYRCCFGAAMTLAVMGYHFQVMTQKLSKAIDSAKQPAESGEILLRETTRQVL
ncbi:MAG: B12-binding domain-containing radical SAM protein, partial [Terracidiphilus sp.]